MAGSQLLTPVRPARHAVRPESQRAAWTAVALSGVVLAVVGWTDLALLWYPLRFGNAEWEFGTVSSFLDGMPLGTVGIALLSAGATALGWRLVSRIVGAAAFGAVLLLVVAFGLYLLTVPVALRSTPPEMHWAIKKAAVKAAILAPSFITFYGWLGWFLWRSSRHGHGRGDR